MLNHKSLLEYPSLLFVCDDLVRIQNSLRVIIEDNVHKLSRADKFALSSITLRLSSHCATIHHHRLACEKAEDTLRKARLSDKEIEDDLPFSKADEYLAKVRKLFGSKDDCPF